MTVHEVNNNPHGSATVVIRKGREKPIINRHPWIFSGAIESVKGGAAPGDIVTVTTHDGKFLARGYWNPKSQIQVRILTWQDEPIDENWWVRMLKRAIEARLSVRHIAHGSVNAYRAVNAENDFLPGLIVDYYNGWFVIQALTLGIEVRKQLIVNLLALVHDEWLDNEGSLLLFDKLRIRGIFDRSDVDVRRKEGLQLTTGLLWGEEPPALIKISEGNYEYLVDVRKGHKTGFYLDQAANRSHLGYLLGTDYLRPIEGHRILNLFSYTGGFGVAAFYGGLSFPERVVNVDLSREALELAEQNFAFQFDDKAGVPDYRNHTEFIQADVFEYLRDIAAEGQQYDVVILDPPKFAHNAQQVDKAARGYKDINLNAFRVVKSGGYLMTFSCSGAIDADLFQKIVFGALADSGREAQILKHLGPGDDHPVALTFPEGAYLKGLLLRVY